LERPRSSFTAGRRYPPVRCRTSPQITSAGETQLSRSTDDISQSPEIRRLCAACTGKWQSRAWFGSARNGCSQHAAPMNQAGATDLATERMSPGSLRNRCDENCESRTRSPGVSRASLSSPRGRGLADPHPWAGPHLSSERVQLMFSQTTAIEYLRSRAAKYRRQAESIAPAAAAERLLNLARVYEARIDLLRRWGRGDKALGATGGNRSHLRAGPAQESRAPVGARQPIASADTRPASARPRRTGRSMS
jgi:hypothetical protein